MTPGSEPRQAAQETVEERLARELSIDAVEERIAEEVVEELDLKRQDLDPKKQDLDPKKQDLDPKKQDEDELPSMSEQIAEQLGGVRGLLESSIPVLAFVFLNVVLGKAIVGLEQKPALYWSIAGAVVSALVIAGIRLRHKQPVRQAVNGLLGVLVSAYFAWHTGKTENFYLPGILITFGQAAVLLASVFVGRPLIGYFWGVIGNKGRQDWFKNKQLFRTFQWLTLVWVVSLCVRAGVQLVLWKMGEATALGIVRILISWPIYAATFAYSAWAIHRVTSRQTAQDEPV